MQRSDQIAARDAAGAHGLGQLRPDYLVSVASRATRLALRSLLSGQSLATRIAMALFLPPLLIVAPMVFATIRVGFVITALFALLRFVGDPTVVPTAKEGWGEWALVAVAAAALLVNGVATARTWIRILTLRRRGGAIAAALRHRALRAFVKSFLLLAIGAIALAFAIVHNARGLPVDALLAYLCLGAAVLPILAARAAGRLEGASYHLATIVWGALTVATASVLIAPAWWVDVVRSSAWPALQQAAHWLHVPAHEAGFAAALVFATLTWGWIGGIVGDARRLIGLIPWAALSLLVGGVSLLVAETVLPLIMGGRDPVEHPPGFSAGLLTGLAVWFVGSHVGWWLSDLLPTYLLKDIDAPKFARVPPAPTAARPRPDR